MTVRLEAQRNKGMHLQSITWFCLPINCQSRILVLIGEKLSDEEVAEKNVDDASSENDSDSSDRMEADIEDGDDDDDKGNVGWANTFAKVLQQEKPKNKKYLVLSRAKKLSAERNVDNDTSKNALTFGIDGKKSGDKDDAGPNEESDEHGDDNLKPSTEDLELAILAQKERNSKLNELRVKPSVMDRERERAFKRIATKGVVQLFNAVRSQQQELVERLEEAGPLDHKRDAVLNNINRRQFLDVLMGGKRAKSENIDNPVKEETDKHEPNSDDGATRPSQWSVLRDDFMTNKKIASHWDNDDDNGGGDDNGNGCEDADSDGDSDWNDQKIDYE